jgi:tetratricopeptide (TPR) repeat protein
MTLSVCFLTRNDEARIGRAIRSVSGVADQVIVADTGSVDRTARIAAELGAELIQHPWEDDFSAGRNFTISRATADWILWLNPDEELIPPNPLTLRQTLSAEGVFAYFVAIQNVTQSSRPDLFSETADLRLFHRRPDLRFEGRIHPGVVPELVERTKQEGQRVVSSELTIRSHAYQSNMTESKLRWRARLLSLELGDRPDRLHYLVEYGLTLLHLGDSSGHIVLGQAADQVFEARANPQAPNWKVQSLLEYLLSVSPEDSRSRLTRDEARGLALRWFPANPPLLWAVAAQFRRDRNFPGAVEILDRLLHLGRTSSYDRSRPFDPRIVGEQAVMDLGACYAQLGKYDEAERSFSSLLNVEACRNDAASNLAILRALRAKQRSQQGPG